MVLTSQERRGQAPGGVNQGKPQKMDHPPSQRQKLPAFFHGRTSYEKSYQPSAISYQQKKKARVNRDNPHVGCALRTIAYLKNNRERLFSINLAKK